MKYVYIITIATNGEGEQLERLFTNFNKAINSFAIMKTDLDRISSLNLYKLEAKNNIDISEIYPLIIYP